MTRIVMAIYATLLATTLYADQPPMPMAMPAAKTTPVATPLPTSPTVPPQEIATEGGCDAGNCCNTRIGFFRRLAALWCGHRYAYVNTQSCTSSFPEYGNYTPIYSSYECGRMRVGPCRERCREHCRRFGFGRFFGGCEDGECRRAGRFARFKQWICWRPCRDSKCLIPDQYQTPIRYYFQGDSEMACTSGAVPPTVSAPEPG